MGVGCNDIEITLVLQIVMNHTNFIESKTAILIYPKYSSIFLGSPR